MYSHPIILPLYGAPKQPKKIHFTGGDLDEGFLQEIVRANPQLLPASDLDPSIKKLISIGREASTAAGSIDNLFVTPEGGLVIVETKLWRNPQARREVVAQIIDYAKDLSAWTFDDFNAVAREYSSKYLGKELSLEALVRSEVEDFDESTFHDNLMKNVERGKFILLIVGDGIREGVEQMVEYLQGYATIHFTLGLVELQLYRMEQGETLLIPRLLLRTREINRAIITVSGAKVGEVSVQLDSSLEVASQTSKKGRRTWDEASFFEDLEGEVDAKSLEAVRKVFKYARKHADDISWGTGMASGSFSPKFNAICPRSPFTVFSGGTLRLHFEWLEGDDNAERFRDAWRNAMMAALPEFSISPETGYRSLKAELWTEKVDIFLACFDSVLKGHRSIQ